jgi:hypothetical protein
VHVGGAEPQLAGARLEDDVRAVGFYQLGGYDLGAVRGAVVDDYELPVEVAVGSRVVSYVETKDWGRKGREAYLSVKVRLSSQVMMGRFWRSLKVGRITLGCSVSISGCSSSLS